MSERLWYKLPISLGVLSAGLMLWDVHNQQIILSMGMEWDTGAPVWPYQTPTILFYALNTPAYIVANPIAHLCRLLVPQDYIVRFPLALCWWWFVGTRLDRKLEARRVRARWLWFTLSAVIALFFSLSGAYICKSAFGWWHLYGDWRQVGRYLLFVRDIAPAVWSFIFAFAAGTAARRVGFA